MVIAVLWRRRPEPAPPKERRALHMVIAEGFRFTASSPQVRTIMLRAFTFTTTGAAAWALMPLVASDVLGRGSAVYGLLLGALGAGAVLGAATSTWFRARFSAEAIIRAAGIVYGLGCLGVAYDPGLPAMLALLVLAGAGWVGAERVLGRRPVTVAARIVGRITAMVSSLTRRIALGSWCGAISLKTRWRRRSPPRAPMIVLPLLGLLLPMPRTKGGGK
jgi:predicted MFS family arabinose efflux permease